jgi:hypothetical protein
MSMNDNLSKPDERAWAARLPDVRWRLFAVPGAA